MHIRSSLNRLKAHLRNVILSRLPSVYDTISLVTFLFSIFPLHQDIFFAGTSSTAETIQWAFASLINHPTVLQKVREEIESVVGRNRLVEEFDIPNLHYLQAVVKEALRLFPGTTLISRISGEDCRIGGFDVPKGTTTYINVYSILRDPKLWDHPDDFHPERFLNLSNGEADQMRQDFSYIPFGGGRRMCPGMNLALCMLHTTIAALVQCFDWKAVGNEGKVNMQAKPGLFMVMAQPLLCLPGVRYYPFPA